MTATGHDGAQVLKRRIVLFPDTNVFVQCLPLAQVDWSEWADYDEIKLIICRPVQRELDKHKNQGNDRLGKRARRTWSMLRQLILEGAKCIVIRDSTPKVTLAMDPTLSPSRRLSEFLDYGQCDDALVGCVCSYCDAHANVDARILTHDTGPLVTASGFGFGFAFVPDSWLLPPEPTTKDRRIVQLEQQVELLKASEPSFRIRCVEDGDNETELLTVEYVIYEPLREQDIAKLMDALATRFPIATAFGDRQPIEKVGLLGTRETFEPAPDEAIANYTEKEYPSWLANCRRTLSHLHHALQRDVRPAFHLGVRNEGSRPGKNVLVIISARGAFKIRPPQPEDDDVGESAEATVESVHLSHPPEPPQGKWVRRSIWDMLNSVRLPELEVWPDRTTGLDLPLLSRDQSRDPDAFYYKPDRPNHPVTSFKLECEQWRHATDEEVFDGEIHMDGEGPEIKAALELQIHAENLSTPVKNLTPVRIRVRRVSTMDRGLEQVRELLVAHDAGTQQHNHADG